MFCSGSLKDFVNLIHNHALRLISDNRAQPFQNIIEIFNEKNTSRRFLEEIAKETYICPPGLSPPIVKNVFQRKDNVLCFSNFQALYPSNRKTVKVVT